MSREEELEALCEKYKSTLADTIIELSNTIARELELDAAIRYHRAQTGHNMCWENDKELWKVLGDETDIDHTLPERCEFLRKCEEYYDSRK